MKMPVTIPFTLVFHTTSFAVATTERKQACYSLFKEGGGTVLIIDSIDSCIHLDVTTVVQSRPKVSKSSDIVQLCAEQFHCPVHILDGQPYQTLLIGLNGS